MYPKSVLGPVEFYIFGKIKLIITKFIVSIANIKFTNRGPGVSFFEKQKKWMNNFFWSMPRPKANQAKRYGSPAFVLRRSGRIVVPATATFMPETESPYKSKTGGAG